MLTHFLNGLLLLRTATDPYTRAAVFGSAVRNTREFGIGDKSIAEAECPYIRVYVPSALADLFFAYLAGAALYADISWTHQSTYLESCEQYLVKFESEWIIDVLIAEKSTHLPVFTDVENIAISRFTIHLLGTEAYPPMHTVTTLMDVKDHIYEKKYLLRNNTYFVLPTHVDYVYSELLDLHASGFSLCEKLTTTYTFVPMSTECSICTTQSAQGVEILTCKHQFCVACWAGHEWEFKHKTLPVKCPLCRCSLGRWFEWAENRVNLPLACLRVQKNT